MIDYLLTTLSILCKIVILFLFLLDKLSLYYCNSYNY